MGAKVKIFVGLLVLVLIAVGAWAVYYFKFRKTSAVTANTTDTANTAVSNSTVTVTSTVQGSNVVSVVTTSNTTCSISPALYDKCGGSDNVCIHTTGPKTTCVDAPWPGLCLPANTVCQKQYDFFWKVVPKA